MSMFTEGVEVHEINWLLRRHIQAIGAIDAIPCVLTPPVGRQVVGERMASGCHVGLVQVKSGYLSSVLDLLIEQRYSCKIYEECR